MRKKIKETVLDSGDLPRDVFFVLLFLFVGIGAFLIGRMSVSPMSDEGVVRIVRHPELVNASVVRMESLRVGAAPTLSKNSTTQNTSGVYVASRNGTVFHLPTCSGAKNIKEENRVWFSTKEEAIAKGYKPAGNCKGI